MKRKQGVLRRN